jgi:hypothetical protein
MSFILDALRKSENKRRKKSTQLPRSIHEPAREKTSGTRQLKILIIVFLLIIILLLAWLTRPIWQGSQLALTRSDGLSITQPQKKAITPENRQDQVNPGTGVPASAHFSDDSVTEQQESVPMNSKPVELPIPRTERKVYAFSQLPESIRRQIPELQMALHAYNRDHASSSMVQLNQRIYRQGDKISPTLQLETITPEGVIIRYDGYRFLLPRRHQ